MTDLLDEIGTWLADPLRGITPTLVMGKNFWGGGFEPVSSVGDPNTGVAMFAPAGSGPVVVMGGGLPPDELPRLQIITRSDDWVTARSLARQIWRALAGIGDLVIGGVRYAAIIPVGSPFDIGPDENNRYQVGANYDVMKELSPL